MTTTTSSLRSRTALLGIVRAVDDRRRRPAAAASRSAPARARRRRLGSVTSSTWRWRSATLLNMKPIRSGPNSEPKQDRISDAPIAEGVLQLLAEHDLSAAASVRHHRRASTARARRAHERVLEILLAGLRRAARPGVPTPRAAAGDHDDAVAERRDFLHHVAGEEHAAPFARAAGG